MSIHVSFEHAIVEHIFLKIYTNCSVRRKYGYLNNSFEGEINGKFGGARVIIDEPDLFDVLFCFLFFFFLFEVNVERSSVVFIRLANNR